MKPRPTPEGGSPSWQRRVTLRLRNLGGALATPVEVTLIILVCFFILDLVVTGR